MLMGLNGIIIKSRGSADASAFSNAIQTAHLMIESDVNSTIKQYIEENSEVLTQSNTALLEGF